MSPQFIAAAAILGLVIAAGQTDTGGVWVSDGVSPGHHSLRITAEKRRTRSWLPGQMNWCGTISFAQSTRTWSEA